MDAVVPMVEMVAEEMLKNLLWDVSWIAISGWRRSLRRGIQVGMEEVHDELRM
jgi:hypothetical protein